MIIDTWGLRCCYLDLNELLAEYKIKQDNYGLTDKQSSMMSLLGQSRDVLHGILTHPKRNTDYQGEELESVQASYNSLCEKALNLYCLGYDILKQETLKP